MSAEKLPNSGHVGVCSNNGACARLISKKGAMLQCSRALQRRRRREWRPFCGMSREDGSVCAAGRGARKGILRRLTNGQVGVNCSRARAMALAADGRWKNGDAVDLTRWWLSRIAAWPEARTAVAERERERERGCVGVSADLAQRSVSPSYSTSPVHPSQSRPRSPSNISIPSSASRPSTHLETR